MTILFLLVLVSGGVAWWAWENARRRTHPGLTLPLFAAMIEHIPYWKILEGLLFHFDKMRPSMFLTFKVRASRVSDGLPPP